MPKVRFYNYQPGDIQTTLAPYGRRKINFFCDLFFARVFVSSASCAVVLRCTPYLDCLPPFVWWQIHADETKSSLQFASRALRVTNCARVNEVLR